MRFELELDRTRDKRLYDDHSPLSFRKLGCTRCSRYLASTVDVSTLSLCATLYWTSSSPILFEADPPTVHCLLQTRFARINSVARCRNIGLE